MSNSLREFYKELNINHKVTSVEHPQTNEQVKVANKIILGELRKRLGRGVTDAMILVEIEESLLRRINFDLENNANAIQVDLNLVEKAK
ncbi:hypothetical protein CR513_00053, partial [Mucuna pruriens]